MPARRRQALPPGWIALDVAALWASFAVAFLVRFLGHVPVSNVHAFLRTAPWLTVGWVVLSHVYGLYERRQPWSEVLQGVFLTCALGTVLAMAISFVDRGFAFPRSVLLIGGALNFWIDLGARRLLWNREHRLARREGAVLVCTPGEAEALAGTIAEAGESLGVALRGVLPAGGGAGAEVVEAALLEWLQRADIEAVVLSPGLEPGEKERAALVACGRGLPVHVLPSVYEVLLSRGHFEQLGDTLAFGIGSAAPARDYEIVKRVIDLSISAGVLLVLSPAIGLIALAIALVDGRPVLYRQERVGRRGRVFLLVKFRTMVVDAEAATGPVLATRNDPRTTRTGRFLRAWHLDELPQLWNVLRGDMSLVGPRPERPELHAATAEETPHFGLRLHVDAGITGLAQVNGRYDTTPEEKLKHDLMYLARSSVLFDINILLKTVKAVWKQRKAG